MTENNKQQFTLHRQFEAVREYECVKDEFADVDTWYTLGAVVDLLNDSKSLQESYTKLEKENKELRQFKRQVFDLIDEKINLIKEDIEKSVKAGMPNSILYSELDELETFKQELI